MRSLRASLYAIALCATSIALVNSAEARHVRSDYATIAFVCGTVPSLRPYIFPVANWEPFFRRHVYRYGPIAACEARTEASSVISVRY
jgi:hypothetical protein